MFGKGKDAFRACKKLNEPVYKVPKSIQESIPISRISQRGTFEIETQQVKMYDRLYLFEDINFRDRDEGEKRDLFRNYCEFLNSLSTNFKVQIFNFNEDMKRFREQILLKHREEENEWHRELIDGFNRIIEKNMVEGANGITQIRFLVITCEKENFENANAYFNSIESNMQTHFQKVGSRLIQLDAEERLKYLFYIYQMGHESEYELSWSALITRHDWRNDVANDMIILRKRHLEFEDKFVCMLYMKRFGSKLPDDFLSELSSVPYNIGITIDSTPVPPEIAEKAVQSIAMDIEKSIEKQQQERNKIQAYSSDISYTKRREKREIEKYMDDMSDNGANLFWTNVLVMVIGTTKEEMLSNARNIKAIAKNKGFALGDCVKKQMEAFNSALPLGGRYVDYTRPLFTQPLAGFIPFNTQEVRRAGGLSYGVNQVSKKLIIEDRKKLDNGNGFVFGVPGSGKSFFVKMEMAQVYGATEDDMLVIDPQNEYAEIVKKWGGSTIDFSLTSQYSMNPFELPPKDRKESFQAFVGEQSEFGVALVHSIMGEVMTPYHKSVIEKSIREMYEEAKENWVHPTMMELKEVLNRQTGEWVQYAKDVLVAIAPFTEGSLNIFAKQSNVDLSSNRFISFGLSELRSNLKKPAMLVMINFINQRVLYNSKKNKATWLWCDEFHVMVDNEIQRKEMEKCYKIFRKMGGIVTGITQNVDDMVQEKETRTMISNCEFKALLKQASLDKALLDDIMEVSDAQLKYITNNDNGTGLIQLGNKVVPFKNRMEKDIPLYELFNTDLHEKAEAERKAV